MFVLSLFVLFFVYIVFMFIFMFCFIIIVVLGPRSGSIGSGTKLYAKLTYRELGSSHERLVQTDVHVTISDATSET